MQNLYNYELLIHYPFNCEELWTLSLSNRGCQSAQTWLTQSQKKAFREPRKPLCSVKFLARMTLYDFVQSLAHRSRKLLLAQKMRDEASLLILLQIYRGKNILFACMKDD